VPRRIVWSLDKADWSVEIQGARFVHGEPQKRSGRHGLKAADFTGGRIEPLTPIG